MDEREPLCRPRLGGELESWRKSLGWSRARLAREAGVHAATISRIEEGGNAEPGALTKIVEALNMGTESTRARTEAARDSQDRGDENDVEESLT